MNPNRNITKGDRNQGVSKADKIKDLNSMLNQKGLSKELRARIKERIKELKK